MAPTKPSVGSLDMDQILADVKEAKVPRARNQYDKSKFAYMCTIVSMLPYSFTEPRPQMLPSEFIVNGCKPGKKFEISHVGEFIHYIPNPFIDEGKPNANIKQVTSPAVMAQSIVQDYTVAQLCTDADAGPGLFWVEGKLTAEDVAENFQDQLDYYYGRQMRWYRNLVTLADSDWNKSKNLLAISDLQRHAAEALAYKSEWVNRIPTELEREAKMLCKFCKVEISKDSVKCMNCKEVVNPELYKQMVGA